MAGIDLVRGVITGHAGGAAAAIQMAIVTFGAAVKGMFDGDGQVARDSVTLFTILIRPPQMVPSQTRGSGHTGLVATQTIHLKIGRNGVRNGGLGHNA